jgi:hypothetical protein
MPCRAGPARWPTIKRSHLEPFSSVERRSRSHSRGVTPLNIEPIPLVPLEILWLLYVPLKLLNFLVGHCKKKSPLSLSTCPISLLMDRGTKRGLELLEMTLLPLIRWRVGPTKPYPFTMAPKQLYRHDPAFFFPISSSTKPARLLGDRHFLFLWLRTSVCMYVQNGSPFLVCLHDVVWILLIYLSMNLFKVEKFNRMS